MFAKICTTTLLCRPLSETPNRAKQAHKTRYTDVCDVALRQSSHGVRPPTFNRRCVAPDDAGRVASCRDAMRDASGGRGPTLYACFTTDSSVAQRTAPRLLEFSQKVCPSSLSKRFFGKYKLQQHKDFGGNEQVARPVFSFVQFRSIFQSSCIFPKGELFPRVKIVRVCEKGVRVAVILLKLQFGVKL